MDKFYTLLISLSGKKIDIKIYSIKKIAENEKKIKKILLSNLMEPPKETIDSLINKISNN